MISKKELNYVSYWASKTPYPGDEYAYETIEKLKKAHKLFEDIYKDNKYNIIFSNNEEIELEIKSMNLAHLLGIDFKNLSGDTFREFRKNILDLDPNVNNGSYALLQSIIENSDKVINFDKTSSYLKALNYYRLSVKSDIFSKLGNLSDFNYGCVVFDKDIFLESSKRLRFDAKSTKYLYMPSDEPIAPYFFMGIKPSNIDNFNRMDYINEEEEENENIQYPYIVETTIVPENPKPYFENQQVAIPTYILKDSNKELTRIIAPSSKKIELLKDYRNIVSRYNITDKMDIYGDYISLLSQDDKAKKLTRS